MHEHTQADHCCRVPWNFRSSQLKMATGGENGQRPPNRRGHRGKAGQVRGKDPKKTNAIFSELSTVPTTHVWFSKLCECLESLRNDYLHSLKASECKWCFLEQEARICTTNWNSFQSLLLGKKQQQQKSLKVMKNSHAAKANKHKNTKHTQIPKAISSISR